MSRSLVSLAAIFTLYSCVSVADAAQRGRGGERGGRQREGGERSERGREHGREAPGGAWQHFNPHWRQGSSRPGERGNPNAATGFAAEQNRSGQRSGAESAAAGAAAARDRDPRLSGAQGAAIANRNDPAVSGAAGYAAGRRAVPHPGRYDRGWYAAGAAAWAPVGWDATAAWAPVSWDAVANQLGYADAAPVSYNYGDNVNYDSGNVTVNGQPAGTAEQYSQQAADLAQTGTEAQPDDDADQWMSLGVFGMVRNVTQHPHLIMQLNVNPQGIIRGYYTDEVTAATQPVHGAVDKQTQRAAWTVGNNQHAVMEAGIQNLTEHDVPALIHKNGTTEHWLLIRLEDPGKGAETVDGAAGVGDNQGQPANAQQPRSAEK